MPPAICDAIRTAVLESGFTQEALASRLGEKQQTISGWMRRREPKLEDISRIEIALSKPRGYLLRAAGYVDETATTPQCIETDAALLPSHRDLLLASYEAAKALSSAARSARTRRAPPAKPSKRSSN